MKSPKDLPSDKRKAFDKALAALEMRNYGLAVNLAAPLVADEPEIIACRELLREAQIRRAPAGKSSFLGISGGGLSLGKTKAQRAMEAGDAHGAIKEAEKALETDPMGVQPNKDLHQAAEMVATAAREEIKTKLEPAFNNATDDESRASAGKALGLARDTLRAYEAIAHFALKTIARDDRDKTKQVKSLHEIGKYLMQIEEYEEARKLYESILALNPLDLDAREKSKEAAARRSMQRGRLGESSFEDLVKQRQEDSKKSGVKAVNAEESDEELIRKVNEANAAGTPDRESARKLADRLYNREDYDNALLWYQYASDLAGGVDPGLLSMISKTEARQVEKSIALKEAELKSLAADDPAASAIRAEIEEMTRLQAEKNLGDARKRVERNPTDLQYKFDLGLQLYLAGHYQEAIGPLQEARRNPNVRTRALYLRGKCFASLNMLDLAAKTFVEAASELPAMEATKKDIVYDLGLVYERMGDKDKSLDCFKQIYEEDVNYRDVAKRVMESYGS